MDILKAGRGTGILNYNIQAARLIDYTAHQLAWVGTANPNKVKRELEAYEAGIEAGWHQLRVFLEGQGIISIDWSEAGEKKGN